MLIKLFIIFAKKSEPKIIIINKENNRLYRIILLLYLDWVNNSLSIIIVIILWNKYIYKEFLPILVNNQIFLLGIVNELNIIIKKEKINNIILIFISLLKSL